MYRNLPEIPGDMEPISPEYVPETGGQAPEKIMGLPRRPHCWL